MKYLSSIMAIGLVFSGFIAVAGVTSQNEAQTARLNEQIEAYRDRVGRKSDDVESRVKLAELLEKKKDWNGVVEYLRPVSDRLEHDSLLLLAKAFGEKKDLLNQTRTLELCLAKKPKDFVAQTSLGEAYLSANRKDDAIATFKEARQNNKQYLPAYNGLLRALLKAEDAYEARSLINDMIKTFGPRPEFFNELCRLYAEDSYLDKAVETCQQAIEKSPRTAENYVYLGRSYKDRQEDDKALKILSEAAAKFPNSATVLITIGEAQIERKDFVAAYKHFRQAVIADRRSAKAVLGYAQASFELQKNQEALDAFVKACTLDRSLVKDFRVAIGKLRTRKDTAWQLKYDDAIVGCP